MIQSLKQKGKLDINNKKNKQKNSENTSKSEMIESQKENDAINKTAANLF